MLFSLTLAFALVAEVAGSGQKSGEAILKAIQVDRTVGSTRISPSLHPESSKKFFNKDYPADKGPKVDVLHFKHPYPVVQDSQEFETDFVADQNKDNGEWKAQEEYDKLRHKLAKLKKKAADALDKKNKEKAELEVTVEKYDQEMSKRKEAITKKSDDFVEPQIVKAAKPVKPLKVEETHEEEKQNELVKSSGVQTREEKKKSQPEKEEEASKAGSWSWGWEWPWSWSKTPRSEAPESTEKPKVTRTPKPTSEPIDTTDAARAVEKAMAGLKECKRQLEEAKAELKKLMNELEQAKLQQVEAHEKVKQAKRRQSEAENKEAKLHEKYTEEAADHAAALKAYQEKKAAVEKLQAQLDAAEAKIKAMRDKEDKEGGVYPVEDHSKSGATSLSLQFLTLALATAGGLQVA